MASTSQANNISANKKNTIDSSIRDILTWKPLPHITNRDDTTKQRLYQTIWDAIREKPCFADPEKFYDVHLYTDEAVHLITWNPRSSSANIYNATRKGTLEIWYTVMPGVKEVLTIEAVVDDLIETLSEFTDSGLFEYKNVDKLTAMGMVVKVYKI